MIYLLRHGLDDETIIGGYSDVSLTDKGIKGVKDALRYIKTLEFEKIISSDVKRCVDTVNIINAELKKEVIYTDELREQDKGDYTGLLKETLPSIIEGTNQSIPQDEALVTYAPVLTREDERIDWNTTVKNIYNKVRGTNPWPGVYTTYEGKTVKIWAGSIHQCENAVKHHAHQKCGTIVKVFKDAIGVKVEDGVYLITEFQFSGSSIRGLP